MVRGPNYELLFVVQIGGGSSLRDFDYKEVLFFSLSDFGASHPPLSSLRVLHVRIYCNSLQPHPLPQESAKLPLLDYLYLYHTPFLQYIVDRLQAVPLSHVFIQQTPAGRKVWMISQSVHMERKS
jgi:hypothetical protein